MLSSIHSEIFSKVLEILFFGKNSSKMNEKMVKKTTIPAIIKNIIIIGSPNIAAATINHTKIIPKKIKSICFPETIFYIIKFTFYF